MGTSDETQRSLSTAAALSSPGSTVRTPAFLGASLRIKGQVTGEEDLRVDGKIEGPISLPDYRLTVGPAAEVKGPVVARGKSWCTETFKAISADASGWKLRRMVRWSVN